MLTSGGTTAMTRSTSATTAKPMAVGWRCFLFTTCTSSVIVLSMVFRSRGAESPRSMKGPLPARVGEEVENDVAHPGKVVRQAGLKLLVLGRHKGPVVEQRAAKNVFPRNKAPKTRVGTVVAVIAHHEVVAGWDDQIAIDDVVGDIDGPGFGDEVARHRTRGHGGKLVEEVAHAGVGGSVVAV